MDENKEIALHYLNSWQKGNFDEFRASLADDQFSFSDGGQFTFDNPDKFVEVVKSGNAWRDFTMIDMVAERNKVSMIYTGTDVVTNVQYRVAEFIKISGGKICSIEAVVLALN